MKILAYGISDRFKARLVASGFLQLYDIDYDEIFAFVTKMTIVHTPLAIASVLSWTIYPMDMKSAFFFMVTWLMMFT